jgi:predicted acylesterase/phospholipase RssA
LIVVLVMLTGVGCTTTPARNPLPLELTNKAVIPGIPKARFWGNEWPKFAMDKFEDYTETDFERDFNGIYNKPQSYLAVSGGGANGAFGAGLLTGWTQTGTRPEFTMVTGISTGALTAPFAFLGSEYDNQLKTVYTTTSTDMIAKKRNPFGAPFADSMADNRPLRELMAKYITIDMIEDIAREHKKGRRLFIGTANLDAGRSVIWNMGAIAASDYPRKVELFYDVLQASSAIPIVFPPVLIPVEAEGQSYDEMHVDGGIGSQVFVYPAAVDWKLITKKLKVQGTPKVYVIRNSFLDPDYRGVKRSMVPIGTRTVNLMIQRQGISNLYQIYTLCERDGNEFNLAYIPSGFTEKSNEGFDPAYMNKLFDLGYQMALAGYPWQNALPGFRAAETHE